MTPTVLAVILGAEDRTARLSIQAQTAPAEQVIISPDDPALSLYLATPGVIRLVIAPHHGLVDAAVLAGLARLFTAPAAPDVLVLSAIAETGTVDAAYREARLPAIAAIALSPRFVLNAVGGGPDATAAVHHIALASLAAGADVAWYPFPAVAGEARGPLREAAFELAVAAKRTYGFAPLAWLVRLAAERGEEHPRRLFQVFNGDARTLDRIAADREASATFAAADLAMTAQARRYEGPPAPEADEQVAWGEDPAYVICDPLWCTGALRRGMNALETARAARTKRTCVIVGNGPSLTRTDLSLLDGQDVFITNYAFRHPDLARHARYLCIVNPLVAEQASEAINDFDGATKIFPVWLGYALREETGGIFVRAIGGAPRFSVGAEGFSWASTVSFFAMQVAYWLGYTNALLIGFDNTYSQPVSAREGDVIEQTAADPNHFDPAYFRGKKWHAADTDAMSAAYRIADAAWRADDRRIVNCTVGGALEVFPRGDLAAELKRG